MGFGKYIPPEFIEHVKLRVGARRPPNFVRVIWPGVAALGAIWVVVKILPWQHFYARNVDWGTKQSSPQARKPEFAKRMGESD